MKVMSKKKPDQVEKLQGSTLVNVKITPIQNASIGDHFEYHQFKLPIDALESDIKKFITIKESELNELDKQDQLLKLTVKTESGKVFYADLESKIDLHSVIDSANLKGISETTWKLAEDFEGSKYVIVSLDEIREALALALKFKGELVGVVDE